MSILVLLVGHNGSGKSSLAAKLQQDFQHINVVGGDELREYIKSTIPFFSDLDYSFPDEKNTLLNPVIHNYRSLLTHQLLKAGQTVLFDASNFSKAMRTSRILEVKDLPCKVAILYCSANDELLQKRLSARGAQWLRQYQQIKKEMFEPPTADECDEVITFDQDNYQEVKQKLILLFASDTKQNSLE